MCRLWLTEPCKFIRPNYFVIDEFEFMLDRLRTSLVDVGYDCPISFEGIDAKAYQINKQDRVILLHTPEIEGKKYIAGLVAPYFKDMPRIKKTWNGFKASGIVLVAYIGILLGIALAGLGVRGPERPYLLDWLGQNWLPLFVMTILLLMLQAVLYLRFRKFDIAGKNYETVEGTYSDLKAVLESLCQKLKVETIPDTSEPYYPWRTSGSSVPVSICGALDELVSHIDGYSDDAGSVLDLKLQPIDSDEYRSY